MSSNVPRRPVSRFPFFGEASGLQASGGMGPSNSGFRTEEGMLTLPPARGTVAR